MTLPTATEILGRISAGETSARAETEACLARISAREPLIRAFVSLDPEAALAEAEEVDRRRERGPLHGVPFAAKDIIDTAGHPTGWGSPIYEGHRPPRDAACIQLLRDAGAVLVGKTVTTEFAYFTPGPTTNPSNPAHTPGGSSSGSAAAVADGMVPLALGSQTAGSLIRPAAYCGVFGWKPGHGSFDLSGVMPLAPSLDTLGGLARSAADLALLHSVLAPRSDMERLSRPDPARPPRFALMRGPHWDDAEPAARDACHRALARLRGAGAETGEVATPEGFAELTAAQMQLMAYEAAITRLHEYRCHRDRIGPAIAALVETGLALDRADCETAKATLAAGRRRLLAAFADVDVLVTLASPGEAPEGLAATGDPLHSRIWTALGLPCLAIPCGRGAQGLPLSVQLVGAPGADATVLRAGRWAEPHLD